MPELRDRIKIGIVSLCGPLVEELPGGIIDVVHFSAKELVNQTFSSKYELTLES